MRNFPESLRPALTLLSLAKSGNPMPETWEEKAIWCKQ